MNKGKKIVGSLLCALLLMGCAGESEVPNGKNGTAQESQQASDKTGEGGSESVAEEKDVKEVLEKKYASYEPCDCDEETSTTWETGDGAEAELSLWYGTWYDEAGKGVEFTRETIDGRAYGVKTGSVFLYETEHWPAFELYYLDSPEDILEFYIANDWFDTKDGEVTVDYLVLHNTNTYDEVRYCEFDKATIESLQLQEEMIRQEELANREVFSKEQVYNKAMSDFENHINNTYAMDERLFMYIEYQPLSEATYAYDADMDEYKIRFKVTVDENMFAFGMYKYTCILRATYTEENGRLTKVSFEVD